MACTGNKNKLQKMRKSKRHSAREGLRVSLLEEMMCMGCGTVYFKYSNSKLVICPKKRIKKQQQYNIELKLYIAVLKQKVT